MNNLWSIRGNLCKKRGHEWPCNLSMNYHQLLRRKRRYIPWFPDSLAKQSLASFRVLSWLKKISVSLYLCVETNSKCIKNDDFVYIFEFKIDRSAQDAIQQIVEKGYTIPYLKNHRRLFRVGVNFSSVTKNIDDWLIV